MSTVVALLTFLLLLWGLADLRWSAAAKQGGDGYPSALVSGLVLGAWRLALVLLAGVVVSMFTQTPVDLW